MSSLLQNISTNSVAPSIQNKTKTAINQNQTSEQIALSPEAKSTLLTGFMSGILGGTWAAPPKHSYKDLIELNPNTYQNITQKAKRITPEDFNAFDAARNNIIKYLNDKINHFFKNKENISTIDILKLVNEKSKDTLTQSILKLENNYIILAKVETQNIKIKELKKLLKGIIPAETLKNITTNNALEIISKEIEKIKQTLELKEIGMTLFHNAIDGKISKNTAQKHFEKIIINNYSEILTELYDKIKKNLPKKRFKSAIKWGTIGIGISILIDTIFNAFRKN